MSRLVDDAKANQRLSFNCSAFFVQMMSAVTSCEVDGFIGQFASEVQMSDFQMCGLETYNSSMVDSIATLLFFKHCDLDPQLARSGFFCALTN